jgi:glycosyltransferase involved in cell wall biosynthesis
LNLTVERTKRLEAEQPRANTRIALYLPSLRGGGAERVLVTLANGFAERGYIVDLVLATAEGPYLTDVASNVRIVDLNARRVSTSVPCLVRYLRREKPAALLSAMGHANVIAVLARSLAGVPTRVIVSERSYFSRSNANATNLRARLIGSFMAWAYPRADGVVAVSAGVADDLARSIGLSRSTIQVVYNPVVTDILHAKSMVSPEHPWLKAGEPPVILSVGRLTAAKDFPTLLLAFARLRQDRMVRLLILGDGELRETLTSQVAKLGLEADVDLPGFAENPFAPMRLAALFVLSSAWEGLPNALIQAMACGTRVVSTDCPSGPAEILDGGRWGRLVPVGDVDAMAEAMAAALAEQHPPDVAARAADFGVAQALDGYLRVMLPKPGEALE